MQRKKILVYAYAISPTRGSEYSVAWNYVSEMSKENELVVLYGTSGEHMGDIAELESYLIENPIPNTKFIAIKPNKLSTLLNSLNRMGIFPYTFYFAYRVWQKQVYRIAKKIVIKEQFDLIHYLGPIGYRTPGYLWKINLPYMWGPIGGTNNVSLKLMGALSVIGKLKFGFRSIINSYQLRFNRLIKKAIIRTDILLTATTNVQKDILYYYNKYSIYYPENSIINTGKCNIIKFKESKLKLIWIGNIIEGKALIILLRSLVKIRNRSAIELHVVGDGPLRRKLQKYSEINDLQNCIIWHGAVQRGQVFNLLNDVHLNIVTSVSEGNPTTIWEAMSQGVPTMSLDHCGMHDTICDKCGIKIPILSLDQVINDIAINIEGFLGDRGELIRLSNGVYVCAKDYTYGKRKLFFEDMYDLAILNWKKDSNIRNDSYCIERQ